MTVLDKFATASRLKANQLKSCIYFGGVGEGIKQKILSIFGMVEGQLPFLGVSLFIEVKCYVMSTIGEENSPENKLLGY